MDTHQMAKSAGLKEKKVTSNQADGSACDRTLGARKKIMSRSELAKDFLDPYVDDIYSCFGERRDADMFMRATVNAIASDANLIRATTEAPLYLAGAVMQAAQTNLDPNTSLGLCFLCPYMKRNDIRSKEEKRDVYELRVSFQLGYQGALLLHRNAGDNTYINAEAVYEKDFFDYELGGSPFIRHKPYDGSDPGQVVKYYAIIKDRNAEFPLFKVWRKDLVVEHAKKFSRAWNSAKQCFCGAWASSFDSMAKKTVLLDCLRYAPKSSRFALCLASDNTTKAVPSNDEGEFMDYVPDMLSCPGEDFDECGITLPSDEDCSIGYDGNDPKKIVDALKNKFNLSSATEVFS